MAVGPLLLAIKAGQLSLVAGQQVLGVDEGLADLDPDHGEQQLQQLEDDDGGPPRAARPGRSCSRRCPWP